LYAADRAEHVGSVVRPALERGAIVISDRYIDSSVAYQGAGRDLSPTEIARISRWATDGLVPHLTVLLDISPQAARERFTEAPDRLESEPAEFHQRVRTGFLTLAAADPGRYLVVDASQQPEAVTAVVRHRLDRLLPLSEAEVKAQEEARKAAEEEARLRAEVEAARKAEEERLERKRQEQLAKLRAEEEERKRRELEDARQREAERQAEEARRRAEDARRRAEKERARRLAEEKVAAAEQERFRKQAEEEARLRTEAEERRLEKQRKAEEALLRAEEARRAAEARRVVEAEAAAAASEVTVPTPMVAPDEVTQEVTKVPDTDATTMLPQVSNAPQDRDVPASAAREADETAVLPPVRDTARDADPADRVPSGIFRDESARAGGGAGAGVGSGENERTRELPQVDPDSGRPRRRSDWAEETPLDDLPTLADELLGPREEDDQNGGRRGRR
jgi:dTMP kinase